MKSPKLSYKFFNLILVQKSYKFITKEIVKFKKYIQNYTYSVYSFIYILFYFLKIRFQCLFFYFLWLSACHRKLKNQNELVAFQLYAEILSFQKFYMLFLKNWTALVIGVIKSFTSIHGLQKISHFYFIF